MIYACSDKGRFGLKEQIRRASVSIMANIAEEFGRGGNTEYDLRIHPLPMRFPIKRGKIQSPLNSER